MRKMGEKYEIVVFTASLAKVNIIHSLKVFISSNACYLVC